MPRLVEGPCLLNVVASGKTPDVTLAEAAVMGFRLAIVPVLLVNAVLSACDAALAELLGAGVRAGAHRPGAERRVGHLRVPFRLMNVGFVGHRCAT